MKKLLSLIVLLFIGVTAFASSPDLQDITLTNYNTGETLDFYADRSNKVVYYAPGAPNSRGGTFYLGRTISSRNGYTEAYFTIELPMSYGMKTLSGTIYYNNSNGKVQYVEFDNGSRYKSAQRVVSPRR